MRSRLGRDPVDEGRGQLRHQRHRGVAVKGDLPIVDTEAGAVEPRSVPMI